MNILETIRKQLKDDEILFYQNIWGDTLKTGFEWNEPLKEIDILSFENKYFKLPKYYKELLLFSNGVTLFKELEYLESGCKIYGLTEALEETHKRIKWGYELPNNWMVFAEFYGSSDFLLFDVEKYQIDNKKGFIIDGYATEPIETWEYLRGNFFDWIYRSISTHGNIYWRW